MQAERTLARTQGGLGLGLALVKGLTELHGGTVRAESAGKGKGAEFVVRLPGVGAGSVTAARPVEPAAPGGSRSVLVVDDNADAAETLADVVRMFGHSVRVAYDGPAALHAVGELVPDLVLCDIGLPGMDGYEVARQLRRMHGASIGLIAVSGYAQPDDVARSLDAGFDAHVRKAPDPEELAELLVAPLPERQRA